MREKMHAAAVEAVLRYLASQETGPDGIGGYGLRTVSPADVRRVIEDAMALGGGEPRRALFLDSSEMGLVHQGLEILREIHEGDGPEAVSGIVSLLRGVRGARSSGGRMLVLDDGQLQGVLAGLECLPEASPQDLLALMRRVRAMVNDPIGRRAR